MEQTKQRQILIGSAYTLLFTAILCANWYSFKDDYVSQDDVTRKVYLNYQEAKQAAKEHGFEFDPTREYYWKEDMIVETTRGNFPFVYEEKVLHSDGIDYMSREK